MHLLEELLYNFVHFQIFRRFSRISKWKRLKDEACLDEYDIVLIGESNAHVNFFQVSATTCVRERGPKYPDISAGFGMLSIVFQQPLLRWAKRQKIHKQSMPFQSFQVQLDTMNEFLIKI